MMSPIDNFLPRFRDVRESGDGWSAKCPAHDDSRSSLSISVSPDGKVLLNCHAGCNAPSIVSAVGLTMQDLFPDSPSHNGNGKSHKKPGRTFATADDAVAELERNHGKRTACWIYHNAQGEPVGLVVRWDRTEGKDIRPVAWHPDGWRIGAMPCPRPLYGLPELSKSERVVVTEGEKAADAARSLGFTATTSVGGARAPGNADWRPLAGKEVWILPDNDEPGQRYAADIAGALSKLTPTPAVRILKLPGLPDKGDIVDWIEAHGDAAEPDWMRKEIEALASAKKAEAKSSGPWTPAPDDFPDFMLREFRLEWLVKRLLVFKESAIIFGPSKTLKTSVILDLAISIATGTCALGYFPAGQKRRVLLISGESGGAAIQAACRRICEARGIDYEEARGMLQIECSLPPLSDPAAREILRELLEKHQRDVVIIDPAYCTILDGAASAEKASNMFFMGYVLRTLEASCTPTQLIMVHHCNQQISIGATPELKHLAYSGFQQFARQWIGLNRATEYENDGKHDLILVAGGSVGHGGKWSLRIDEGELQEDFSGRKWEVTVEPFTKAKAKAREDKTAEREQAKEQELVRDANRCFEVITLLCERKNQPYATKADIRGAVSGWSGDKTNVIISRLLFEKRIIAQPPPKTEGRGGNRKSPEVYVPAPETEG